jgi:hypothetical protein
MMPSSPSRRRARPVLCALGAVLAFLLLAPGARAAEPDYSGWKDFLKKYLIVLHQTGKPLDTRFDYEQLYVDEGIWTKHRSETLDALHTQLLSVDPSDMTRPERTAWAINAYNFLVIERMTLYLLVPGRKFMRFDSPRQVNRDEGSFFAAPVAKVDGRDYSLTGFERRFVYGDTTADPTDNGLLPRTRPGDPRLAFAVCKGSLATGPLQPWVYRADSLEKQLDRATRTALALPAYVTADAKTGELAATNRFFEERCDYGGNELTGVLPFLKRYGSLATRQLITRAKLTHVSRYFEPDWKLNQFDRPKPKPPTPDQATTPKSN